MRRTGKSRTAIGVDVGSRSIKVAQLVMAGGEPQIAALSMLPRTKVGEQIDPEGILIMKRALKRQGFYGNDIVLAPPEADLLRGIFDVPSQVSGAPIAQIARMELSRLHNVMPDSFEMVYWDPPDLSKSKSKLQGTAIGCTHEAADAFINLFEDSGFRVTALDIRIAAAVRACRTQIAPAPALTCILNIGWESTNLLLLHGRTVVYERPFLNKCLAKLGGKLSETFGITEAAADQIIRTIGFVTENEASELNQESLEVIRKILRRHFDIILEEQLEASFDYANYQYPGEGPKRLLLIGEGAGISGLPQYFHSTLGIEVRTVAPSDVVEESVQIFMKASHPAMTVAVGLAMFNGE